MRRVTNMTSCHPSHPFRKERGQVPQGYPARCCNWDLKLVLCAFEALVHPKRPLSSVDHISMTNDRKLNDALCNFWVPDNYDGCTAEQRLAIGNWSCQNVHFPHCSQGHHVEKLSNTNINHSRSLECSFRELLIWDSLGFSGGAVVKNLPASAGDTRDTSSIPGSGRFPGIGKGNPLQSSCLENPMDRGAWQATYSMESKSYTTWATEHTHVGSKGLHLAISVQPKLWFKM